MSDECCGGDAFGYHRIAEGRGTDQHRSRSMGKLIGIAIKKQSRGPMQLLDEATVTLAGGVNGDYRGRRGGPRQVTVLVREAWDDACRELGADPLWTTRRANLLVDGVKLEETAGQ